jgi:hypothetical protein
MLSARYKTAQRRRSIERLFPSRALKPIMERNRETLQQVQMWIDDSTYEGSVFNYGLPRQLRSAIDRDIGSELTYSDALIYVCTTFERPIRYLELGVSVGKNFAQMLFALKNCELIGFDIEEVNPTIEKWLKKVSEIAWDTPANSLKKTPSSLKRYRFDENQNDVSFLCADIWDENAWSRLQGKRFDVVFSDALHTPDALLHEHAMLEKFNLLADEFVMLWDDLDGPMMDAFKKIKQCLEKKSGAQAESHIVKLRGWLGINEDQHTVGLYRRYRSERQHKHSFITLFGGRR